MVGELILSKDKSYSLNYIIYHNIKGSNMTRYIKKLQKEQEYFENYLEHANINIW